MKVVPQLTGCAWAGMTVSQNPDVQLIASIAKLNPSLNFDPAAVKNTWTSKRLKAE